MKLTVRKEKNGRAFIVVILIVIMVGLTFGGIRSAPMSYREFCQKQFDNLKVAELTHVYQYTLGSANEFLLVNHEYIKKNI